MSVLIIHVPYEKKKLDIKTKLVLELGFTASETPMKQD